MPCPAAQGASNDSSAAPLALYSCPIGPTCVARSRHQLVGFNWMANTFDSVWQVRSHRQCHGSAVTH
jgi:hypothetical protein